MKRKRKFKNRIKGNLLLLILIIVVSSFLINTGKLWFQIIEKKKEVEELSIKKKKLEREESFLTTEVEKLQDPDYIARYAREKYLYSKEGEFTIRIK